MITGTTCISSPNLKIEQNFYEKGGVAKFFWRLRLFYRYFCVVKKCDYFF